MGGRRLVLVAVCVLLSSCGLSSAGYADTHSAAQIMSDASTALAKARSYHLIIHGTFAQGSASADLKVEGDNYSGALMVGSQPFRFAVFQGETYIYGGDLAASLQSSDPQAAAVIQAKAATRWVHMPPGADTSITSFFDVKGLGSCLQGVVGLVKKSSATINGQATIEVDDLAGSKLFIGTSAPHYPVRLAFTSAEACLNDNSQGETVDLSQFGAAFQIEAPPGFIDLAALAGG